MPVPANTFLAFQAIGNREDLIDIITILSPMDTWFTSNTGSTRAISTYHEWQTDVLDTPAANAQVAKPSSAVCELGRRASSFSE